MCELAGFAAACRDMGLRGARLALNLKPHQFYRLRRDLKKLEEYDGQPRFTLLAAVKAELTDFLPMTKSDLGIDALLE